MSKLAVCACYFNPMGWQRRIDNLQKFVDGVVAQGGDLWLMEGLQADGRSDLTDPKGIHHIKVRMGEALWQKERMFNLIVKQLPPEYDQIVWADADILWDSQSWTQQTSNGLQQRKTLQPFTKCIWLNADGIVANQYNDRPGKHQTTSFASAYVRDPKAHYIDFGEFHPGYSWAIRRDVYESIGGVYDLNISGAGDSFMTIGFCGMWYHPYYHWAKDGFLRSFDTWAKRAFRVVHGSVGCVPGVVRHLWHGPRTHRGYNDRLHHLSHYRFDPEKHLEDDENGLLRWSPDAPSGLITCVSEYFYARREDG